MAFIIEVKVVPSSGCNRWKLEGEDRLKCYLKSAPERGKANQELIDLFAKALKIPASACTIISGATSRLKRVRIDANISCNELLAALGIERQMRLL